MKDDDASQRDGKVGAGEGVVLDSIPIAVKAAEVAVELKRFNGTSVSRSGTFMLPSPAALAAVGQPEAAPRTRRR